MNGGVPILNLRLIFQIKQKDTSSSLAKFCRLCNAILVHELFSRERIGGKLTDPHKELPGSQQRP